MNNTKKLATNKMNVTVATEFADSFAQANSNYFMYFGKSVPYGVEYDYEAATVVTSFNASSDISNNTIAIYDTSYQLSDRVRYYTDTGITPITGLVNNQIYYILSNDPISGVQLTSSSTSTEVVSIQAKGSSEIHYITYAAAGSGTVAKGDTVETPVDSELYTNVKVYDDMLFAKRITENDVRLMVAKHMWTEGNVYDQYDNNDPNLQLKPFFATVNDVTEYNVYKCLFNNGGIASTITPSRTGNSADYYSFQLSDGYVWKYMFTITKAEYEKFATTDYIPLVANTAVADNAVPGTVDVIQVVSGGRGYDNWLSGTFQTGDIRYNGVETYYALPDSADSRNEFYQQCVIKIVSSQTPGAVNQYRTITGYVGQGVRKYVIIDSPFSVSASVGDTYEIYPKLYVWGDGSESKLAVARAIVNQASGNTISEIEMLSVGSNYRTAVASLALPNVIKNGSLFRNAIFAPVVSPSSGHGAAPAIELGAKQLGISIKVEGSEGGTLPTTNDFRSIGIIKNPEFNNVIINYDNAKGSFSAGEVIHQYKDIKLYGSAQTNSGNNTIYKLDGGLISSTVTIAANGTGYDHTVNNALVFDNTDTRGSGAAGTYTANIAAIDNKTITAANSITNSTFIAIASNPFVNGNRVKYGVVTGSSVVGLASGTYYYVVNSSDSGLSLSLTSGGTPILVSNALSIGNSTIATVNGSITAVTITNQGAGYITVPTIAPGPESGGSGAVLVAALANPEVTSFDDSFSANDIILLVSNTANFISTVATVTNPYNIVMNDAAISTANCGVSKVEVVASGVISSVSSNQLTITNLTGTLQAGKKILGMSSYATAVIADGASITINDRNPKGFVTTLQLSTMVGSINTGSADFIADEKIYQDSINPFNQPSARVFSSINSAGEVDDIIYVTRPYGVFNIDPAGNRDVIGEVSESNFTLFNLYPGDFVKGSGEVLYIENIDAINRSNSKSEIVKVILQF